MDQALASQADAAYPSNDEVTVAHVPASWFVCASPNR